MTGIRREGRRVVVNCHRSPLLWTLALVGSSLLVVGCASTPPTASPALYAPYLLSRDGALRYRVPAGWFPANTDSTEPEKLVFLVRNDYAGSLTVHEVHLDDNARSHLDGGGLLPLAQLTASLEAGSKSGILSSGPTMVRLNGKEVCSYEMEFRQNGDKMRVVLVDAGGHVYSVAALVNGSVGMRAVGEILTAQQAFVATLKW